MGRARCIHGGVTRLARDFERAPTRMVRGFNRVTRNRVKEGAKIARLLAFYSANRHRPGAGHGKWYWRSITPRMFAPTKGEWGPEPGKMQADMSFEWGSRNQPPHLDMTRSADLTVPKWHDDIQRVIDETILG